MSLFDIPIVELILGAAGLLFVGYAGYGVRTGTVRIPVVLIAFEEFERERAAGNFWSVVCFNLLVGMALIATSLHLIAN